MMDKPNELSPITFGPFSPADFDYYYAVRSQGMRPHVERAGHVWDEAYEVPYHRSRFHPESLRTIYLDGDRIGFIAVRPIDRQVTAIESFCLIPEMEGKGIGSRILSMVLAETDLTGQTVELEVMQSSPASNLFQRFDFQRVGQDGELVCYRRAPSPVQQEARRSFNPSS